MIFLLCITDAFTLQEAVSASPATLLTWTAPITVVRGPKKFVLKPSNFLKKPHWFDLQAFDRVTIKGGYALIWDRDSSEPYRVKVATSSFNQHDFSRPVPNNRGVQLGGTNGGSDAKIVCPQSSAVISTGNVLVRVKSKARPDSQCLLVLGRKPKGAFKMSIFRPSLPGYWDAILVVPLKRLINVKRMEGYLSESEILGDLADGRINAKIEFGRQSIPVLLTGDIQLNQKLKNGFPHRDDIRSGAMGEAAIVSDILWSLNLRNTLRKKRRDCDEATLRLLIYQDPRMPSWVKAR